MGRHFIAKLNIFVLGALAFLGCAAEPGGENIDPSAPDNGKTNAETPIGSSGEDNSSGAGKAEQNADVGGETEQNPDACGEAEQNANIGGEAEQKPDAGGGASAGGDDAEHSSDRQKIGGPSVAVEIEALPNLHRVSADLYRSAQPAEGGLIAAQELGARSVLSLSVFNADAAMPEAQSADLQLQLHHYPLVPWAIEQSQIAEMMQIFESLPKPALVHCYHGADRTGLFVAVYRILYQNWTKDEAKEELINGGYGYHETFSAIPAAIDALDEEFLRSAVFGAP